MHLHLTSVATTEHTWKQ